MTRIFGKLFLTTVMVAALTACGGDDNSSSSAPPAPPPTGTTPAPPPTGTAPPPATPSTIAARFGAAFASIFGASANSEPKDPAPTDLAAVNTMSEPIDF
jgi:hypothetical protein